jgi:LmbE family N-acetylglucosaminyl deacetylase
MASILTSDDIRSLGTIMGVWAHPDDETFTAAGIMATAVQNGQKVICVTATRGEGGLQDESRWPAAKLADIREQELKDALQVLGVSELQFLPYKDGMCHPEDSQAIASIKELINTYKPDTILTFGKDGLTGHPDHIAVCEWANRAVSLADVAPKVYYATVTEDQYSSGMNTIDAKLNYFYNLDKPNLATPDNCQIYFKLSPDAAAKKYQALCAMPSQYTSLIEQFSKHEICQAFGIEAFTEA